MVVENNTTPSPPQSRRGRPHGSSTAHPLNSHHNLRAVRFVYLVVMAAKLNTLGGWASRIEYFHKACDCEGPEHMKP